mmetsp:Transcript_65335/g.152890  ORF Transcript_65335/g.152890 Transcript_65335/m.152890 type:complete len:227 (+) Transcript_65335:1400-2080(+)
MGKEPLNHSRLLLHRLAPNHLEVLRQQTRPHVDQCYPYHRHRLVQEHRWGRLPREEPEIQRVHVFFDVVALHLGRDNLSRFHPERRGHLFRHEHELISFRSLLHVVDGGELLRNSHSQLVDWQRICKAGLDKRECPCTANQEVHQVQVKLAERIELPSQAALVHVGEKAGALNAGREVQVRCVKQRNNPWIFFDTIQAFLQACWQQAGLYAFHERLRVFDAHVDLW